MVSRSVTAPPRHPPDDVHYPESDGKPVAETDAHIHCLLRTLELLYEHFRERDPQVYVGGNMFVYYEPGNTRRRVAPDVFVVRGVPAGYRRVYKVWEEGRAPDWVLEVSSRGTRHEDLVTKRNRYAALGVREYFLFDPLGEYLQPRLQGYRLVDGTYEPLAPAPDGSFTSAVLGLEVHPRGTDLRFYDPHAGQWLLMLPEALARAEEERVRAEEERVRAEEERRRADAAEAELARLRAELARLRGER
ncbi:MAG: Uma2 family endonuclease [Chloroflexi bacterium]|nr:Uma2 family endonuclease [Chloroflexota bacterium]